MDVSTSNVELNFACARFIIFTCKINPKNLDIYRNLFQELFDISKEKQINHYSSKIQNFPNILGKICPFLR